LRADALVGALSVDTLSTKAANLATLQTLVDIWQRILISFEQLNISIVFLPSQVPPAKGLKPLGQAQ